MITKEDGKASATAVATVCHSDGHKELNTRITLETVPVHSAPLTASYSY